MELDSLKKSWLEVGGTKPLIDETKIQYIINNRGKSAYNSLLKYEQIMTTLLVVITPFSFVFKDNLLFYIYIASIAIGLTWQFIKYRLIKSIDFSNMNLIEISSKTDRYRKYLIREIIVNSVWAVLFIALWIFRVVYKDLLKVSLDPSTITVILILAYIVVVLSLVAITLVVYKKYASKNIKRIEQSIKEIKEFEDKN